MTFTSATRLTVGAHYPCSRAATLVDTAVSFWTHLSTGAGSLAVFTYSRVRNVTWRPRARAACGQKALHDIDTFWTRPVHTVLCSRATLQTTHEPGPSRRPEFTGSVNWRLWIRPWTRPVDMTPMFTGHVDGSWTRCVLALRAYVQLHKAWQQRHVW